jgi:hypothetical protein
VVRSVLHDTGADARLYIEEEHSYQGGRVDLQGRGFLGFSRHVVRNTTTGEVVDRRFNAVYDPATRSYPGAGRPRAVLRYRLDPSVVGEDATRFVGSKQLFTYDLRVTDVGTHYVVTTSTRTREYEEDAIPPGVALGRDPFLALLPERTVTSDMTYDSFGSLRRSRPSMASQVGSFTATCPSTTKRAGASACRGARSCRLTNKTARARSTAGPCTRWTRRWPR